MLRYKRIGLTVKSDLSDREETVRVVLRILQGEGAQVFLDDERCDDLPCALEVPRFTSEEGLDLLLVIGGDGTILRCVRTLKDFSIPILSVNKGAVGFLAETNMDEARVLLPKFLRGEGVIDQRSVLSVEAMRGDDCICRGCVLNEAVISQGSIARIVNLRTTVNGEELTTFRADGLIIATPTGSTAYSLAAGGPIVHPRLPAAILTPINSHSFTQKPIVLPGNQSIEVEVLTKDNKFGDIEVSLTLDGQTYFSLQRHDIVRAKINAETVKFLRRKEDTFYATLREKLKWGDTLT